MTGITRRGALRTLGAAAAASLFETRGAFADELAATPRLTEGPFYPDRLPLDTDNDLLILGDSLTPAVGEITHLSGQVLTRAGSPVRGAYVEIWQVDAHGNYIHSRGAQGRQGRDPNFQGYGRFLTDLEGRYAFRTIKPVVYPGRVPHIHMAISHNGRRVLTTQIMIRGYAGNERDGVLRSVRDGAARDLLLADFAPIPGSRLGELACKFDVVLGVTPADPDEPIKGGIGRSEGDRGGPGGPGGRGRGRFGPDGPDGPGGPGGPEDFDPPPPPPRESRRREF